MTSYFSLRTSELLKYTHYFLASKSYKFGLPKYPSHFVTINPFLLVTTWKSISQIIYELAAVFFFCYVRHLSLNV